MVGREVSVLFEKPGRLPGQMVGKSSGSASCPAT
jgi:tRNA-2-methylthio-N6-dimethylallyladenosine synthase